MKKKEFIKRYGKVAYEKMQAQNRAWQEEHPEQAKAATTKWQEEHPDQMTATHHEQNRKGGSHYEKWLKYKQTGLPGERNRIRMMHGREWRQYKSIIAPHSQIHHEWVPGTSEYNGVALVEKDQHMHGFVDVIEIPEGKITRLTEEAIREGMCK